MTPQPRAPRISIVGSYGTGLTMRLDHVPGPGETLSGATFSSGAGGKGSNQAIGAARLGAHVRLLTTIGDDAFGAAARDLWAAEHIDASAVVTVDAPTMVGVILVEATGENRIVIAAGALDLLGPHHVEDFAASIADSDLMMVCNEIPVTAVVSALRTARRHNVATLLNPAPARELPEDAWPLVDYLTPNLPEGRVLAGLGDNSDIDATLDALRRRFPATIVMTAGAAGAYVDDPSTGQRTHIPAIESPQVVDTTGAGDAFNAAFATAVCGGATAVAAARQAVAAGSFAVGRREVIPALPTASELTAVLSTSISS